MTLGKIYQSFPCYKFHHIWLWLHCCCVSKERWGGKGPQWWNCHENVKSGCQPHFLHLISRVTTWSKSCILFSTYITILFSHSSHHWASNFLLFRSSSLYSTYSTTVLNSLFEVIGLITWLTSMFIAFCWDSI